MRNVRHGIDPPWATLPNPMRAAPQRLPSLSPVGGDVGLERLTRLLSRQELFVRDARSPHRLPPRSVGSATTTWFGVGVTAGGQLSHGLPIDVLGLLYAQELVRRTLGLSRSLVLVADENARAAGADAMAVRRRSVDVQQQLTQVATSLHFPVEVRLASSLGPARRLPGLAKLDELPRYIAHQLAQTECLRQQGASIKLGWAWPGAARDERYFDDLHAREYGTRIASVYVVGGSTLDPRRPRACPYVCSDLNARLLLRSERTLEQRLASAPTLAARRYERLLGKLARAHCRLTGTERSRRPAAVLQSVVDDLWAL